MLESPNRQMPHSTDAEQAILGAMLLDEKVCEDVGSNAEGSCLVYSVYGEKKGDCFEIIRKKHTFVTGNILSLYSIN